MAAQPGVQNGGPFLLSIGGTTIGGGLECRIRRSQSLNPLTSKGTDYIYQKSGHGMRSAVFEADHMFLESARVHGSSCSMTLNNSAGTGVETVMGWKSITINLVAEYGETTNATVGLDRAITPISRAVEVSWDGDWYDPEGANQGAGPYIAAGLDGSDTGVLSLAITVGSSTITVPGRFTERSTAFPIGYATESVSFQSSGIVADSLSSIDTGLDALLDTWFDQNDPDAFTALISDGVTGATEYTGSVFPGTITITIPHDGELTVALTCPVNGALTESAGA